MAYFAKIVDSTVETVIVAVKFPGDWFETDPNTKGGVHYSDAGEPDGGIQLRKNFAGVGYSYDKERDAFIPPKPFPSWILNEESCLWEPPTPCPEGNYNWDESTLTWIEVL